MSRNVTFRPATKNDARHLAHLVNFAGEGIPYYFWQKNAEPGQDPWDIGKSRAEREEGSFSYRHTIVAEIDGELAGCLVTYVLPEDPEPIDYDEMPPIFVPIQELEDSAPSTQYVSVLAAYPQYRNLGVGSGLLKIAEKEGDGRAMSIIVSLEGRGQKLDPDDQGIIFQNSTPDILLKRFKMFGVKVTSGRRGGMTL